ncbi:serine/threonine-protein phosphatase [Sarotherodon galilaeus]
MAAVTVCSTTKGLFLMFTLLSLVCLSSALIDKELKQLKENYQNIKQQLDSLKAKREERVNLHSELLSEYLSLVDPLIALMKKSVKVLPDGFPQVDKFIKSIMYYAIEIKANSVRENEEMGEKIEEGEMKLGQLKKLIEVLEEKQAEL